MYLTGVCSPVRIFEGIHVFILRILPCLTKIGLRKILCPVLKEPVIFISGNFVFGHTGRPGLHFPVFSGKIKGSSKKRHDRTGSADPYDEITVFRKDPPESQMKK